MTRLVVVSNRVAMVEEGKPPAGGLAVAILAALQEQGGIWFGWNGEITPTSPPKADVVQQGRLSYATIGMTRRDYNDYYEGFSNSTLWPLFHYRLDLSEFNQRQYAGYQRVNRRFAQVLFPILKNQDLVWVHDYHLIPMAGELRRMGAKQPLGFFLHTPFPALEIMLALPRHGELMRALSAYDQIGFQTINDLSAFHDYIVLEADGTVAEDGEITAFGRTFRADVFPIGIDTGNVVALAEEHERSNIAKGLRRILNDRHLIVGVDRLDYSKGLPERFLAYERLLANHPQYQADVTMMQIAPPSRASVRGYADIRKELETLAGHINGRFAEFDWVPLRYLNRSFSRSDLAGFFRAARVAMVTPLRDGMNLVAKEYIASQRPRDPGVLILSRFAGAARELDEALLVNPHDVDGMTGALERALTMPLAERIERWRSMMDKVTRQDVHAWRHQFVNALEARRHA